MRYALIFKDYLFKFKPLINTSINESQLISKIKPNRMCFWRNKKCD